MSTKQVNESAANKAKFLCEQLDKLKVPYMLVNNHLIIAPTTSPLYESIFPSAWHPDGNFEEFWLLESIVLDYDLTKFEVDVELDTAENILLVASKI